MARRTLFLFVIVSLMWNESHGCFSNNASRTILVKTGTDYYNECECTKSGYDIRYLEWRDVHDNVIHQKRPGTEQKVFTLVNESCCVNLHIPYVSKALSGPYKCITNFEGKIYEQIHYVMAYDPITINPPENQFILLGNRSLIRCEVHADPSSTTIVSWYKEEDGRLTAIIPSAKYSIVPEGLYISDVVMEDEGRYSCTALDLESNDGVDKNIDVQIITFPVISNITTDPGERILVGHQLRLECIADGIPHPEYIWRKINEEPNEKPRWEQRYNTILIERVQPEDQGTYECTAQSMAGVVTKTVFIQVVFPPHITSFPNITAREGQTVQLVCDVIARPTPNTSIIFVDQDRDINEIDDNDIIPNYSFLKVQKSDMGVYVCNASNEVDFTMDAMFLTVEYKPYFDTVAEVVWGWEGQVVNLSCPYDSNPPAKLTWRYQGNEIPTAQQVEINKDLMVPLNENGVTYVSVNVSENSFPFGVYECKATNELGEDTKIINFKEAHAPPIIQNPILSSVGHTSAKFNLSSPDPFEGPEVQGFTCEYDKEENYNITHIHINRTWAIDRPYFIDNLEPNTTYFIRFAAINKVGTGPWSEMKEFQTQEPSIPNTPEWEVMSDFINLTSVDQPVRWLPAEGNGAYVDHYTVRYCLAENEDSCAEVKVAGNAELKLDNSLIEYNNTYFVELIAHNRVGSSIPANLTVAMSAEPLHSPAHLSAGALIGVSVVVVFLSLLLLDAALLLWRRQGVLASCCLNKKNKGDKILHTRDKKGLLRHNREPEESLKKDDNGHKEFEYNKTTGIITGRHSAV